MKKIGYFLILLGIMIILLPAAKDLREKNNQNKLINSYIEMRDQYPMYSEDFIRELVENLPVSNDLTPQSKGNEKHDPDIIGLISIPKIKVNLPLLYDATEENLWKGAALVKGTSFPWEGGNTAIAGHRGRSYGYLFNRLHEMEKGDTVILEFLGKKYEYEVYEILIVSPKEVWVLENIETKTTVTLITCTPSGAKRLIVRGRLLF